ncbi:hypothetical protein GQ600_18419 [Phytophthora cactorum]|nr:hypothetical protein GQ600_18419 [Phytophthora cactorum]
MFGLQSSTEDATRLRASYLGDNLVDEKLLQPTQRHRSRQSGIWKIFSSRAIETVYIESTGITELGNGERVGYELLQSNGRRQAIISYCYVYRQPSPDVMEVFMLGSTSRDGVLLGGALAKMHSLHRLVRCAERKKLAWLLNSSQPTLANPKAGGSCAEFSVPLVAGHTVLNASVAPVTNVSAQARAEETSPLTVAAFEAMEQGEDFDFDTFDSSMPPLSHPLKWSSQCLDVDDDLAMTILGD